MKKYIFFRTDRIGDFLLSAILIKSIKRNDNKAHITIIASELNYKYIKTLSFVDEVILYPTNFINKLIFFYKLTKNKSYLTVVLDGKKRSIYGSIASRSKIKILLTTKILYKNLFKLFFNKIYHKYNHSNKLDEIKSILKILNFSFSEVDLNLFDNENLNDENFNFINDLKSKPILFHFDEKWINGSYINKFENIQPDSLDALNSFLLKMINSKNKDIIITTGINTNNFLDKFKDSFNNLNRNIYKRQDSNNSIFLITDTSFLQLKYLISKSSTIISCHGAVTHVSNAMNKFIIDIYDRSEESFYKRWNSHFRNYKYIYRKDFKNLSNDILKLL